MPQLNAFQLKLVAIICMIIQHTALALDATSINLLPIVRNIMIMAGGVSFPIIAYLLVEGYKHTSSKMNYMLRMFIFALIAQAPFHMALSHSNSIASFNVMFTLTIGLLLLAMYDKLAMPLVELGEKFKQSGKTWKGNSLEVKENRRGFVKKAFGTYALQLNFIYWFMFAILLVFSLFFDWGLIGLPVILMYYMIKTESLRRIIPSFVIIGFLISMQMLDLITGFAERINNDLLPFATGVCIAALLLQQFTGERGRHGKISKWSFYVIYPLHLAILALIVLVL